jgi:hypothetical protein
MLKVRPGTGRAVNMIDMYTIAASLALCGREGSHISEHWHFAFQRTSFIRC